jgi:hypothetical protein
MMKVMALTMSRVMVMNFGLWVKMFRFGFGTSILRMIDSLTYLINCSIRWAMMASPIMTKMRVPADDSCPKRWWESRPITVSLLAMSSENEEELIMFT